MTATAHYILEHELKTHIATMPERDLRRRLQDYVTEAPVSVIERLNSVLGLNKAVSASND